MADAGRLPIPLLLSAAVTAMSATVLADWRMQQQYQQAAGPNRDCYRTLQNPYVYFGSKTTYGAIAGNDLQTPAGVYARVFKSRLFTHAHQNRSYTKRFCTLNKAFYHDFPTTKTSFFSFWFFCFCMETSTTLPTVFIFYDEHTDVLIGHTLYTEYTGGGYNWLTRGVGGKNHGASKQIWLWHIMTLYVAFQTCVKTFFFFACYTILWDIRYLT